MSGALIAYGLTVFIAGLGAMAWLSLNLTCGCDICTSTRRHAARFALTFWAWPVVAVILLWRLAFPRVEP